MLIAEKIIKKLDGRGLITQRTLPPDSSWNALLRPWISSRYFDLPGLHMLDPGAPAFSLTNAWWLCELSRVIYRQDSDEAGASALPPTRSDILNRVGLKENQSFCHGTNYCSLITTDTGAFGPSAVLVFRGTRGFKSWPSNLNASQRSWSGGGTVHGGFKTGFNGLWQLIEPMLSRINLPLFFTGHSLGGALAVLAASMCPEAVVYTFGAPKTGDSVFARSLERYRIYRVENDHDIVPSMPPFFIHSNFHHVGVQICLKDDSLMNPRTCSPRSWVDPPSFLSDHAPVNYSIRLENMMSKNARSPICGTPAGGIVIRQ